MRKLLRTVMIGLMLSTLTGCSLTYDFVVEGDFYIGFSQFEQNAFAGSFLWDQDDTHMEIVVPDEYQGIPITQLGGYTGRGVPTPFGINLDIASWSSADEYFETGEEALYEESVPWWDDYEVFDFDFNLYLGVNIVKMQFIIMNIYYIIHPMAGGQNLAIICRPRVKLFCDEGNETFYSLDGKLYKRADDSLVTDFIYVD